MNNVLNLFMELEIYAHERVGKYIMRNSYATADYMRVKRAEMACLRYEIETNFSDKLDRKDIVVLLQDAEKLNIKRINRLYNEPKFKAALNPLQTQIITSTSLLLVNGLNTITQTTALNAAHSLSYAMDRAFLMARTGLLTDTEAKHIIVKEFADAGIENYTYASGVTRSPFAVADMMINDYSNQASADVLHDKMQDIEADLVQVIPRVNVSPDHADMNGKIFSLSGIDKKYPSFQEVCVNRLRPIHKYNCKCTEVAYFEFDKPDIEKIKADPLVYEAEQKQRAIEREIRSAKKQAAALESIGGHDYELAKQKVKDKQKKMRNFFAESDVDLVREYSREKI